MKRKIALINARIIDPESSMDQEGYLLIEDDRIVEVGSGDYPYSFEGFSKVTNCGGNVLSPSIIDIQAHLRDPGQKQKEDIVSGSLSAAAGGITTVVCQPNTLPALDNELAVDYLVNKSARESRINIRFYGAITYGIAGKVITDMGMLHHKGACGFTDDGKPVMNSKIMLDAMKNAADLGVVIAQHAEDINLSDGGCMNFGSVSKSLGVKGIPSISETIIVERDLHLCKLVPKCHYHVLHVSAKETVDAIRHAKAQGINVTCEATPHHFTIDETFVFSQGAMAKMNPPLKTVDDVNAIVEGLVDGTIDCIATDHAPHELSTKQVSLMNASFGIIGFETMLPLSLNLYHHGLLSLNDVLGKLTYRAADIIKESGRGRIRVGSKADLMLIDPNKEYRIDVNKFLSKSKNSPFDGFAARGVVLFTMANGECVYVNEELFSDSLVG